MGVKLSETVYNGIREKIGKGIYDQRTFLNEAQLAEEYSVSRAPVRDALHLLCNQGILISYPRKGYMVNIFTREDHNAVQEIRRHLELLSVRLAVSRATDEEILSLREFTVSQLTSTGPGDTNNTLFHLRLAEISGNKYLPETLSGMLLKVSNYHGSQDSDLERHGRIVDALLERDTKLAEECIIDDIRYV